MKIKSILLASLVLGLTACTQPTLPDNSTPIKGTTPQPNPVNPGNPLNPTNPTDPPVEEGISLPDFKILTTGNVGGVMDVIVQLTNTGTDFTPVNGQTVDLQVFDARGAIIATYREALIATNDGSYVAVFPFDFNSTIFNNESYTLKATTAVQINGENTPRTLRTASAITNQSSSGEAPALSIIMPAFFDDQASLRPILSRRSAIAMQISDSDGIRKAQLQFVCDQQVSNCQSYPNTLSYNYNIPVGGAGIHQDLFNIGFLMDGQPYLPDGNWIMRLNAVDMEGNHNYKEMAITINRNAPAIASLQGVSVRTYENADSTFTPAGALWTLEGKRQNPVRVITVVSDNGDIGYLNEAIVYPNQEITYGRGFIEAGVYSAGFLVQDLVTGVVEYAPFGNNAVYVSPKKEQPAPTNP